MNIEQHPWTALTRSALLVSDSEQLPIFTFNPDEDPISLLKSYLFEVLPVVAKDILLQSPGGILAQDKGSNDGIQSNVQGAKRVRQLVYRALYFCLSKGQFDSADSFVRKLFGETVSLSTHPLAVMSSWKESEFMVSFGQGFSSTKDDVMTLDLDEPPKSRVCGHVFKKGEVVYRCRTCSNDDTCVFCARCFDATFHAEHDTNYMLSSGSGGCCDCGDPESWRKVIRCKHHGETIPAIMKSDKNDDGESVPEWTSPLVEPSRQTIRVAVQFLLDMFGQSFSDAIINSNGSEEAIFIRLGEDDQNVGVEWNDEEDNETNEPFQRILNIMGVTGNPEMELEEATENDDDDDNSDDENNDTDGDDAFNLEFYDDYPEHFDDLENSFEDNDDDDEENDEEDEEMVTAHSQVSSRESSSSHVRDSQETKRPPKGTDFAVVLYNDEVHSFPQVIEALVESIDCSESMGRRMAETVDERGRETVFVSRSLKDSLRAANILRRVGLHSRIVDSQMAARDQLCIVVLQWLMDISRAHQGLRRLVCETLVQQVGHDTDQDKPLKLSSHVSNALTKAYDVNAKLYANMKDDWAKLNASVRVETVLDLFFWSDYSLWKEVRSALRELYIISLLVDPIYKWPLAKHFALNYPRLTNDCIDRDREPDLSGVYFSVQVFTTPTHATWLVRDHQLMERFLGLLMMRFEMAMSHSSRIDCDHSFIVGRRYFHMLHDLRYILATETVKSHLCSSHGLCEKMVQFLSLFEGINPQQRQVNEHVEYESESWLHAFNLTLHLSRSVHLMADVFGAGTLEQLLQAIQITFQQMLPVLAVDPHAMEYHPGAHGSQIIRFNVSKEPVSLHHPVHWFLARLLTHVPRLGGQLSQVLSLIPSPHQNFVCALMEVPLRTIVTISQMRAGDWVRNGFNVKHQVMNYTGIQMREETFEMDLFLLQVCAQWVPSAVWLDTVMDRFGLLSETALTLTVQVDDAWQLLVWTVCERSLLDAWPIEREIRRELLQWLFLGAAPYSELRKKFPDRLVEHASFTLQLKQCTQFRFQGDQGVYELSIPDTELVKLLDPFYWRYARKDQELFEEKYQSLMKRLQRSFAYTPKQEEIPNPKLQALLLDPAFSDLAMKWMQVDAPEKQASIFESVMDKLIYLLLFLVQQKDLFSVDTKLLELLFRDKKSTRIHAFSREMIVSLPESNPLRALALQYHHSAGLSLSNETTSVTEADTSSTLPSSSNEETDKKRAARERQARIMAQMQRRQQTFMQQHAVDVEEPKKQETEVEPTSEQIYENVSTEAPLTWRLPTGQCIVCQEELNERTAQPFGAVSLIQQTRIERFFDGYQQTLHSLSRRLFNSAPKDGEPFIDELAQNVGAHLSTCGHLMHIHCWHQYLSALEQRQPTPFARNLPDNAQRGEFLCPLCKSFSNSVVPCASVHQLAMQLRAVDEEFTDVEQQDLYALGYQLVGQASQEHLYEQSVLGWMTRVRQLSESGALYHERRSTRRSGNHEQHDEAAQFVLTLIDGAMSNEHSSFTNIPFRLTTRRDSIPSSSPSDQVVIQASALNESAQPTRRSRRASGARLLHPGYTTTLHRLSELVQKKGSTSTSLLKENTTLFWWRCMSTTLTSIEVMLFGTRSVQAVESLQRTELSDIIQASHRPVDYTTQPIDSLLNPLLQRDSLTMLEQGKLPQQLHLALKLILETCSNVDLSMRYSDSDAHRKALADLILHFGGGSGNEIVLTESPLTVLVAAIVHLDPRTQRPVMDGWLKVVMTHVVVKWCHVLLTSFEQNEPNSQSSDIASSSNLNAELWKMWLSQWLPAHRSLTALNTQLLEQCLIKFTLPFLRRATLLMHIRFDTALPEILCQRRNGISAEDEWAALCAYLRLPLSWRDWLVQWTETENEATSNPLFKNDTVSVQALIQSWTRMPTSFIEKVATSTPAHAWNTSIYPRLYLDWPLEYELVPLPVRLDLLLEQQRTRTCRKCGNAPPEPALCLFCGHTLCSQTYCCTENNIGECNQHKSVCSSEMGLFILPQKSVLLALYQHNGAFHIAPYLDAHGESDMGLRRGLPMYLVWQRLDEVRKLWLQHRWPSVIAKRLEQVFDQGGWTVL